MVNDVFLSNLVPHMYKSEFDDRAADFLSHYCKEALEKPMPVPIEDIARHQLHMAILEVHLSEDLSILVKPALQTVSQKSTIPKTTNTEGFR